MSHDLTSFKKALSSAPAIQVRSNLFRRVEFLALINYDPPNWLYTSGKPQRYNPAGIDCVYFCEDQDTARIEFQRIWKELKGANQPATEYCATVNLRRVLDLTSKTTLKILGLEVKDLSKNWRLAKKPTFSQLLGQAVSETCLFSAIRYPSAAAARQGQAAANFVIFKNCVHAPDSVRIIGRDKNKPLQCWP